MAFNIETAEVIWKWNRVYRGLGSKAEAFSRYFVEDIRNCNLPATKVEITQLKVGFLFGGKREYLEISAEHLADFRIFLGARAYGTHLSLSKFLVIKPGILGGKKTSFNTFELQDLGDYLASAQTSLDAALRKVAQESGLDPKELNLTFDPLALNKHIG